MRTPITAALGEPMSEVPPFEPPVSPCIPRTIELDPSWRVASEVAWPGLVVWFADGPVFAGEYTPGGGTPRIFHVDAGASCEQGG